MRLPGYSRQLLTVERFWDFVHRPENKERFYELVRGEVIELPRPTIAHGVVCANVARILGNHAFPQGYVVANDAGVILHRNPDTVRGPDIAYFEEPVASFADLPSKWAEVPPGLVVEVISPNDRADDLNRRITDYLAAGVKMILTVDPASRTVTIYRPDKGPRLIPEKDDLTGDPVLPDFRCRVADFFFMPQKGRSKANAKPRARRKKS